MLPPICRDNAELARPQPGLVVLGADECLCTLTHTQAPCKKLWVSPRQAGPKGALSARLTRPPAPGPQFGAIHVCCFLMPGHTCSHMSYFLWEDKCF